MFLIYKAWALNSPRMEGITRESVQDILGAAQRWTANTLIRRHIIIEYLQALAYLTAGNDKPATEFALSALEKCIQIRSHLWRNHIEEVHQQCLHTPFSNTPLFAYLGLKLRTWDS